MRKSKICTHTRRDAYCNTLGEAKILQCHLMSDQGLWARTALESLKGCYTTDPERHQSKLDARSVRSDGPGDCKVSSDEVFVKRAARCPRTRPLEKRLRGVL